MSGSPSLDQAPAVLDWLGFETDGRVAVRSGKVDIGQRIATAVALIAAEELDLEPDRVDVFPADTDASPDEGYSSGSNSMEHSGNAVRLAAATARRAMLDLAARTLKVDPASLEISDGAVCSRETNRSTTWWALAPAALPGVPVDPAAQVKAPNAYRSVGRRATPRNLAALVDGRVPFVHDLRLPGMLHARVVRPPHYRGRLAGLDESVCAELKDVRLIRDGSFLAVAAEDEYAAVRAAARVAAAARWEPERGLDVSDVYGQLLANPRVSLRVVDGVPREGPVPERAPPPAAAKATVEGRFERPYTMHGSLGPSAALARFADGRLTVRTHSQGVFPLRATLAETLALDPARVRVIHTPGAGCYGHNGADDAALDAALVAMAVPGRPILLVWSREDEHRWEPYGSAMVVDVRASIDAQGKLIDWSLDGYSDTHINRPRQGPDGAGPRRLLATRHRAKAAAPWVPQPNMGYHAGIHRNADPYYRVAQRRIVKHLVRGLPLRTSTLRSLGAFINVLAIESTMDRLAEAAGEGPVAFRLRHLDDPRARQVIEAAAKPLGFRRGERAPGRGHGLGFARYKNAKTYAAVTIELEVDDAANVRLHRAVVAADAGQVVDPDGLAAQLEGGLLQAASWTLYEEVIWDEDGITSVDWDSYPVLRFDNVPGIETVILDRPGEPYLGAGEAPCGPTVAAIASAIHDATGLRPGRLPFRPDALRAAALT